MAKIGPLPGGPVEHSADLKSIVADAVAHLPDDSRSRRSPEYCKAMAGLIAALAFDPKLSKEDKRRKAVGILYLMDDPARPNRAEERRRRRTPSIIESARRASSRLLLLSEGAMDGARGKASKDRPVVENVKLLGLKSRNGRRYLAEAARKSLALYEGAACHIDHSDAPRRFIERFGRFTRPRFIEGDGIRADFRFNPKHPHADTFLWWLENDPQGIGFSHAAEGRVERKDGQDVVTEIMEVYSVDLVCDPATTAGIRESRSKPLVPSFDGFLKALGLPPAHPRTGEAWDDFLKAIR